MPDAEETRWKARYERAQEAYQKQQSEILRLEARVDVLEAALADKPVDVLKVERAAAKADREATRKRRFQERVAASIAARHLRDKP
jgi:cell division septum initiation protein DivIVA